MSLNCQAIREGGLFRVQTNKKRIMMFKLNRTKPMKRLSKGFNNEAWLLDQTTVVKVFDLGDARAQQEHKLLSKANKVNSLLVQSQGVVYDDDYRYELLKMPRLWAHEKRAFDHDARRDMLAQFQRDLAELHAAGWAHGDIQRNASVVGGVWDNVLLTPQGIFLIDAGEAKTSKDHGYEAAQALDAQDIVAFAEWFLND